MEIELTQKGFDALERWDFDELIAEDEGAT